MILPEFAFMGRSNCGKSSLINHFLGRKRLALTSGQPGRTRLLNYYLVQDRYYLVDLPGYGFARVRKQQREAWSRLVRAYLGAGDRPLAVFHLLDVRRRPSPEDVQAALLLQQAGLPLAVAVTKIDKEAPARLPRRYREIIQELGWPPETPFFPTSARMGWGRKEMLAWVEAVLEAAEQENA
jgi:GTP-binding protein